jgi:hypothetical protein
MIRRDYILRMIEQFMQALARLQSLKKAQNWDEGARELEEEFQELIGTDLQTLIGLSETELLARIIQGEPTLAVRDKTLMLARLLKEAGEVAAAQERLDESRLCYLKGLHLLLDVLGRDEISEIPAFVPQVEFFVMALQEAPLPFATQGLLMQHYERTGEFAKAEDALFGMLELQPQNHGILQFGTGFYQRLQSQSDATLEAGNLPRAELEAGLREFRDRATAV